jgi:CRP-like cAMP-binding protein
MGAVVQRRIVVADRRVPEQVQPRLHGRGGDGWRARARSRRELASALAGFPAFSGCLPADLEALAATGRVTSLPAHWAFLHEGTPADSCYVLLDGQAEVRGGGARRDLLGPGSVLGEMGLLGRSLRRATVVTTCAATALHVDYEALAGRLRAHPRLADAFGAVYDQHLDAARRAASGALTGS